MDFARARANMVANQLRPNRIQDPRLLEAMGEVPRELFLPKHLRGVAYHDEDIDLGNGRRLIEPLALAKMLEAARVRSEDAVLVIGCDTGYSAAVLSRLAGTVFLLIEEEGGAESIEKLMLELGCENVLLQPGDPRRGLPQLAPFDLVLIAGGVREVPRALIDQLADGGRLVTVLIDGAAGKVAVFERFGDAVGKLTPFDAWVPPLPALLPEPGFTF